MLPKNLRKLKEILEEKGYKKRTSEEDRILEILENIEKEFEEIINLSSKSTEIKKSINEGIISKFAMTGGPMDKCPCCGK